MGVEGWGVAAAVPPARPLPPAAGGREGCSARHPPESAPPPAGPCERCGVRVPLLAGGGDRASASAALPTFVMTRGGGRGRSDPMFPQPP